MKCERVVKNAAGEIVELRCTYDPESLSGATATRRVKGTIHWVSAPHSREAEVRIYDRLFQSSDPGEGGRDPLDDLNPDSFARCLAAVSSRRWPMSRPERASSSSGSAISARIPTHDPGRRCSTER